MRSIEEILDDIEGIKKKKRIFKKEYGKHSKEYCEIKQELFDAKDELNFVILHQEI